ncbi:unnamed protein product [Bursaphelenchus xylophilus]|uniref:UDP-glucuronosyltransferase n=1 Tax=Bursaphelenchus xylophilus TaxID=6326 RepID=A0A1I7RYX0_BURXY|nr:unnamed protein product [Bursaphelenchus xylophilus]CAG9092106.1 unnamed protein product [Bursaphelenchus xylophilus]
MNFLYLTLILSFIPQIYGYRFLFQVINTAYSHVSYAGKLADFLVEQGHQVDFVVRRYNTFISGNGAKTANVIVHTPKDVEKLNQLMRQVPMYHDVFTQSGDIFTWKTLGIFRRVLVKGCEGTLEDQDLTNRLKSQKYDAAFVEHYDSCGLLMAELLGIKTVMYFSVQGVSMPHRNHFSIPSPPGLIPVYNEVPPSGHRMSFVERAINLYHYFRYHFLIPLRLHNVLEDLRPGLVPPGTPSTPELASRVVYNFVNSLEFLNFPDFSTTQIKHVGGIGLLKAGQVDDFLLPIIKKAKKGVVWFSFGSIVDTKKMSPTIKNAFIAAFSQFEDYQFLWQMNNAEDKETKAIFAPYSNIHVVKWVNQPALLANPKTKAMISHGGLTGLFEAVYYGVPLISIPMFMDHKRSAALAKYHGIGVILDKYTLSAEKVAEALKEVLENPSYKENILITQAMMKDAPRKAEQIFLDSVTYATKYGHRLQKTNVPPMHWIPYFCVDVVAVAFTVIVIVTWFALCLVKKIFKVIPGKRKGKKAKHS